MHHTDAHQLILSVCDRMQVSSEVLYGVAEVCCKRDFNAQTAAGAMGWAARDFEELAKELKKAIAALNADSMDFGLDLEEPESHGAERQVNYPKGNRPQV